jgi:hypothetical protein
MLVSSTRSILRAEQGDAAGALAAQLALRPAPGAGPAMDVDFDGWLRIARALQATGDTAAARDEAQRALAWARTFGTRADRAGAPGHGRAGRRRGGTGARVRRDHATGVASLTPKTVEMHLGRVYRKLDIGSRRQLASALGDGKVQGEMPG